MDDKQQPPANLPIRPQPPTVAPMPRPTTPPPVAPAPAPMPPRPTPPVAPTPPPAPAIKPQGEPFTSELRTMSADIGRISTGQPITGTRPAAPAPSVTPSVPITPTPAPAIIVPRGSRGSIGKKIAYALLAIVVISVLFWLASIIFGATTNTPVASSSPSPSETTSAKTLQSYFGQPTKTLSLNADGSAKSDLISAVTGANPTTQEAVAIGVTGPFSASLADLLGAVTSGTIPQDLKSSLGTDWTVLAFGQDEQFDSNGQKTTSSTAHSRMVLISEVTDATKAGQTLQQWQLGTLAADLHEILGYDTAKKTTSTFASGTYQQMNVSYLNFPYADSSIDWAIVTASNNTNYLVISGSRQSMFFAIDHLMQ